MKGDPKSVVATFETWIIRKPNAMVAELPGKFTVTVRLLWNGAPRTGTYRLIPYLIPGNQPMEKTFPESKFKECTDWVRNQFKTQLTEWTEIR